MTETLRLAIEVDASKGTAVVKEFTGVIDNAKGEWGKAPAAAKGPLDSLSESWVGVTAKIGLATAAIYGAKRAIYDSAKEISSQVSAIQQQSVVLGISIDEFQKWRYAAKMSDVSAEEFASGLKLLSRNMQDASSGSGDAAKYFSAMGVSVATAEGNLRPLNQVMGDVMNKFAAWEDGPRKIAIAMQLFGRSGETLIPFLNKGREGFAELAKEAERLGVILSPDLVRKASEAEDAFKRIGAQWQATKNSFAGAAKGIAEAWEPVLAIINLIGAGFGKIKGFSDEIERLKYKSGSGSIQYEKKLDEAEMARETAEYYRNKAVSREKPPLLVDETAALKRYAQDLVNFHEVDARLLKDQESTMQRMVLLQEQLNTASDEAIAIAERMGIGTKASLTQWIEKDIVGEYEKVLGAKTKAGTPLFSGEEIEQFKTRYTEALKSAMGEGGWGSEFRQIEEAINRINAMKIDDTQLEKVKTEFQDLKNYMEYLNKFTATIKLDDEQLEGAKRAVDDLRAKLVELTAQNWTIPLWLSGSTALPITEKIQEIENKFEGLFQGISNRNVTVKLAFDRMEIMDEIGKLSAAYQMGPVAGDIQHDIQRESLEAMRKSHEADIQEAYGVHYYGTSSSYWEKMNSDIISNAKAQIKNIDDFIARLDAADREQAAQAAPAAAASESGGGYGGGVEININTINVIGGSDLEIAQKIDEAIAELIFKDRSKIKAALA